MRQLICVIAAVLLLAGCAPKKSETQLRSETKSGILKGCKENTQGPVARLLDEAQYDQFCTCVADKGSEAISPDDMKKAATTGEFQALQDKMSTQIADCAKPIMESDFKGMLKRECLRTVEAQGITGQKGRDFCACTATKSVELLGNEGKRRMIDATSPGQLPRGDMAKMQEAMTFCRSTL